MSERVEVGRWYDPITRRARYCQWIYDSGGVCQFRASVKAIDRGERVLFCKRHAKAQGWEIPG
jgi:hypothetical protein